MKKRSRPAPFKPSKKVENAEYWRKRLCVALGFGDEDPDFQDDFWSWEKLIYVVTDQSRRETVTSLLYREDIQCEEFGRLAYRAIMHRDWMDK